jgi:hypothetical protein
MGTTDEKKLLDYARQEFRVTVRPNEAIAVTLEQVVNFANLLRRACIRDFQGLILKAIADTPEDYDGKTALQSLGEGLEGRGVDSWGLSDR